jgi:large subunit ribosomal protein L20
MARVKRGTVSKRKHNKLLESVKGYRGSRSRLIRTAKAASLHSGQYAFHGRKLRKRDFRTLWITRISEATKQYDLPYSVFIYKLKHANIMLDRKILSELVVNDPETFKKLVGTLQSN